MLQPINSTYFSSEPLTTVLLRCNFRGALITDVVLNTSIIHTYLYILYLFPLLLLSVEPGADVRCWFRRTSRFVENAEPNARFKNLRQEQESAQQPPL